MKKLFLVLVAVVGFGFSTFAQCVEVKGVETRKVNEYNGKGFEFNNLNGYTVTIDAELRRSACVGGGSGSGDEYVVLETQSIVLGTNQKRMWNVPLSVSSPCGTKDTYVVIKIWKCP
jgi:hypothetical protein